MLRHSLVALALIGMSVPSTIALAKPRPAWSPADGYRTSDGRVRYRRTNDGVSYYRGRDGRYYCKRSNGTTGLLIGGVAGALVGRTVDTRGERATGTIVGAVAGAVAMRHG